MLREKDNPAYQLFRNILPPSGLYPARWVDIFSNTDTKMRYADVEVVFIPRGADVFMDRVFWSSFAAYNKQWLGDLGNSVSGWMEPGGLNPEMVFGGMLHYGFASQEILERAIREFAHIEECGWARRMKKGLLSEVFINGAQDREAIVNALKNEYKNNNDKWILDILEAIEE